MKEETTVDLKETLEALEAVKVLGVSGLKIAKDGLGADDIAEVIALAQKADTIIDGVKDADQALEELKEISQEEAMLLVAKVFEIIKALKEAKQ